MTGIRSLNKAKKVRNKHFCNKVLLFKCTIVTVLVALVINDEGTM